MEMELTEDKMPPQNAITLPRYVSSWQLARHLGSGLASRNKRTNTGGSYPKRARRDHLRDHNDELRSFLSESGDWIVGTDARTTEASSSTGQANSSCLSRHSGRLDRGGHKRFRPEP